MTRKQKNLTQNNAVEALEMLKDKVNVDKIKGYEHLIFGLLKSTPETSNAFLNLVKKLKNQREDI
tara:strand:- start:648 stop:842 length:195 start_codon:yes stop_codon:yes gene_type:complete